MRTFKEYIDAKFDGQTYIMVSLTEIQKDWNIVLKDVFYMLATLPYHLRLHESDPEIIVIVDQKKLSHR